MPGCERSTVIIALGPGVASGSQSAVHALASGASATGCEHAIAKVTNSAGYSRSTALIRECTDPLRRYSRGACYTATEPVTTRTALVDLDRSDQDLVAGRGRDPRERMHPLRACPPDRALDLRAGHDA